jgi:hypothetical protein
MVRVISRSRHGALQGDKCVSQELNQCLKYRKPTKKAFAVNEVGKMYQYEMESGQNVGGGEVGIQIQERNHRTSTFSIFPSFITLYYYACIW